MFVVSYMSFFLGCTRTWSDDVGADTVAFFRETCPPDIVLHPTDMEAVQLGRTHPAHINGANTIAPILALIESPSVCILYEYVYFTKWMYVLNTPFISF